MYRIGITSLVGRQILALDFELSDGVWAPIIRLNSSMVALLPSSNYCSAVQDQPLSDISNSCSPEDEECAYDPSHTYLGIVVALTEKSARILCSSLAIKRIVR